MISVHQEYILMNKKEDSVVKWRWQVDFVSFEEYTQLILLLNESVLSYSSTSFGSNLFKERFYPGSAHIFIPPRDPVSGFNVPPNVSDFHLSTQENPASIRSMYFTASTTPELA